MCRLCLLKNFIFLFNSENISFYLFLFKFLLFSLFKPLLWTIRPFLSIFIYTLLLYISCICISSTFRVGDTKKSLVFCSSIQSLGESLCISFSVYLSFISVYLAFYLFISVYLAFISLSYCTCISRILRVGVLSSLLILLPPI